MPLPNEGAEFREAATKLLEVPQEQEEVKPEETATEEVKEVTPETDLDAVEKKLAEEAKAKEEAPLPPEKKDEAPLKDRFGALVREKAQLRKREQQLQEMERKLSSLQKAIDDGDVLGLVTAAGFNHQQYVSQMVEGKKAHAGAPAQSESGDGEVAQLKAQLARVESMLAAQQTEQFRRQISTQVSEIAKAKADKLPFVNAQQAEQEAINWLGQFMNETGEMPDPDLGKSLELALEAVEDHYATQAKKWESILTKTRKPAQTSGEAVKPREEVVEKSGSKTLSAGMSAPTKKVDEDDTTDVATLRARARALLFNK